MIDNIREPKQQRAIEKKEKIIEAGFNLICKNGYYNTNTAEIAKEAGVSTGIVYQYFKDKYDILIEALEKYGDDIFFPMLKAKDVFPKTKAPHFHSIIIFAILPESIAVQFENISKIPDETLSHAS